MQQNGMYDAILTRDNLTVEEWAKKTELDHQSLAIYAVKKQTYNLEFKQTRVVTGV